MQIRKVDPKLLKPHPLAHLIPDMRHSEWQDFYNDIAMMPEDIPPKTMRPWEKGKKFPKDRQLPLI